MTYSGPCGPVANFVILTNQSTPTGDVGGTVGWHGNSPLSTEVYPSLLNPKWQGRGRGSQTLVNLRETIAESRFPRGPRFSPKKGDIDCWMIVPTAGSAKSFFLLGQDTTSFSGADLGGFRLGITAANKPTLQIYDSSDVLVVNLTGSNTLAEGSLTNFRASWNAVEGTASITSDGAISSTTVPSWDPYSPTMSHLNVGPGASQWPTDLRLVQIA